MKNNSTYEELENQIAELKLQNMALLQSNLLFQNTINKLPFGIQIFDRNGFSYLFNEKQKQLLGLPDLEEGIGKFNVLSDKFSIATGANKIYEKAYKGETFIHEFDYDLGIEENTWNTSRDIKTLNETIIPIVIDDDVQFVVAVLIDITEQRKAEHELKDKEEKFRNALEFMPIPIALNDNEQNITFLNRAFTETYGYSKDDIKTLSDWFPKAYPDASYRQKVQNDWFTELKRAKDTKSQFIPIEVRISCKSGDVKTVLAGANIFSGHNEKNHIVSLFDITDLKIAEKALKESEKKLNYENERFHTVMNSIDAIVYVSDINNHEVLFVNNYARKLFGNIVGAKCYASLQNESSVCSFCTNPILIQKSEKSLDPYIWEFQNKKNNNWYLIHDRLIQWTNGELVRLEIATDITNRKYTELQLDKYSKELAQLNLDKDRFLSIMAHDLKNPFNALLGLTDLLSKNLLKYDLSKIENFVLIINQSAQKIFNLLEDLLIWANLQSGKFVLTPKLHNISDICYEELEQFKFLMQNKNITADLTINSNLNIFADLNMIKTVLRNLISNAVKFTNNGGHVNISAEQSDTEVLITVSDNGIGIPPDVLNKLFSIDIYTSKGTDGETGTGLGLLLCKDFVQKHGGKIWVDSELKKGSSFKFTIPLQHGV